MRAQSPGTDLDPARRAITAIRDEASSALMLLRVNTAEDTQLSPAFQWAQSLDTVFLNVKFSSRMDGPTTVLNVVDENVTITRDSLSFSAMGKDKPKRIRLQLTFARDLDPEVRAGAAQCAPLPRWSIPPARARAAVTRQPLCSRLPAGRPQAGLLRRSGA